MVYLWCYGSCMIYLSVLFEAHAKASTFRCNIRSFVALKVVGRPKIQVKFEDKLTVFSLRGKSYTVDSKWNLNKSLFTSVSQTDSH